MHNLQVISSYGWGNISPASFRKRMVDISRKIRKLHKEHKFDVLVFTGTSGCAAAFGISTLMKIPSMYIRKKGEDAHTNHYMTNHNGSVKSYLIIDDFIDRGDTVNYIIDSMNGLAARFIVDGHGVPPPVCAGIFLYQPIDENVVAFDTTGGIKVPIFC